MKYIPYYGEKAWYAARSGSRPRLTKCCGYVKLPDGFYISTPVGHYNPDWAIAFYEGTVKHIYFIAETKGTTLLDRNELRGVEDLKIQCAKAHFATISNDSVVYDVVDSYDKLMQVVME